VSTRANQSLTLPPANFLIDSGATHDVIGELFARRSGLLHLAKPSRQSIAGFNGSTSHSSSKIDLHLENNPQTNNFIITNLKNLYEGILGMPWVRQHSHCIDWAAQRFKPPGKVAAADAVLPCPPNTPTKVLGNARIMSEGVCVLRTVTPLQCKSDPQTHYPPKAVDELNTIPESPPTKTWQDPEPTRTSGPLVATTQVVSPNPKTPHWTPRSL
jgi:hypothetical protein